MKYYLKATKNPENIVNYLDAFLTAITPGRLDAALMSLGASLGAVVHLAFGAQALLPLSWLGVFVVLDFTTGLYAAIRTHSFSSRIGFIGIPKKVFIFLTVALCHGLDVSCGIDWCEQLCIFAYCVNEFGSLIENVIRAGHRDFVPSFIQRMLAILENAVEGKFTTIGGSYEKEGRPTGDSKQQPGEH